MIPYQRPALGRRPLSIGPSAGPSIGPGPRLAIRGPAPHELNPPRGRPALKQNTMLRTPRRSLSNSSDSSSLSSIAPTVGSQSEPVSPRLLPRKNSVRFRKPATASIEFLERPPATNGNNIEFLNRPAPQDYPLVPYAQYGPAPEDDEDTTSVSSEITSSSQTTSTDSDATSRADDRRPGPGALQRRSPSHPPPAGILTRRNSNGDNRSVSSRSVTQASISSRAPRTRPLTIEIHTPQAPQAPVADSTNNTQAIALRDEVEGVLLSRIKQLEDEMQDLQASKVDMAKKLDTALVQLDTARIDSDEGEKQWAHEREILEKQLTLAKQSNDTQWIQEREDFEKQLTLAKQSNEKQLFLAKQSMEKQWGQERQSLQREFEHERVDLESQREDLENQRDELENQRDELESQLAIAKKNVNTAWPQEKLMLERNWDRERQAMLQDLHDREEDFHSQRRDYELARREIDEQQRMAEEFRVRLADQSQRLAATESERDRLIDSQRVLEELRSGFESRGSMLEMVRKDHEELRVENSDLRSRKLDLDTLVRKLEDDLNLEKQVGSTLIAQIAALELTSAAAQGKVDALNADRLKQIEEITILTMDGEGLRADIARLEAQIAAMTEEKATSDAEKAAVQARLAEVEVEAAALKAEKDVLEAKVEALEAEATTIKSQLAVLEVLKTDQQTLLDTLTANRDDLTAQVGALKTVMGEQEAEMNSLRTASADRSSDIAKLVEENKVLLQTNAELRALPAAIDTTELQDLRSKTEAQASENAGLSAANAGLTESNAGLADAKAALEGQLKDIESQKQTLRSSLEQLETANAAYRAESASLQTQLAQLKQQRKHSSERTPKVIDKKKNLHMVREKTDPSLLSFKEVIKRSVRG